MSNVLSFGSSIRKNLIVIFPILVNSYWKGLQSNKVKFEIKI